ISVFPFIEGATYAFEQRLSPAERASLVDLLARLHRATPAVMSAARRPSLQVAGRAALEEALRNTGRAWSGGPFAEPARVFIDRHRVDLRQALDTFDELAGQIGTADRQLVISHGEPHPANLINANGKLRLVDWDTVGLAPLERDLWMLGPDS